MQSHQRSSYMETSRETLGILFPPDTINTEHSLVYVHMHFMCMWNYHVQMHIQFHAILPFNMCVCGCVSASVSAHMCVCVCVYLEICASLLCLSSKGFSPDNVMSGCVSSTNPSLDSNISSQSETPSSLCCVPSFHIQQH